MRGRNRNTAKEAANRASEIKDQAREVAGQSGEALKEFADHTGVAAKEFAAKAKEAAKELVESIDKAAKGVTAEPPKKRHRLLKLTLAIGTGIAVFTNDRVRQAISSALGQTKSDVEEPAVWRPQTSTVADGDKKAAAIAEETS